MCTLSKLGFDSERAFLTRICDLANSSTIRSDIAAIELAMACAGVWPVSQIPSQFNSSLHCFRPLEEVERFCFFFGAVNHLLEEPCLNTSAVSLLIDFNLLSKKIQAFDGTTVFENGVAILPSGQTVNVEAELFS